MLVKIFYSTILALGTCLSVSAETKTRFAPTECIKTAIHDLESLLSIKPNASKEDIKAAIDWVFNFEETSKRALGSEWIKLNPDQKDRYITAFSNLLLNTYVERLKKITTVTIEFKSETVEQNKAVVNVMVKDGKNIYPFIFKMLKFEDYWQIYDVVIENVGLVVNYRNEFAAIIRKDGVEGLIDLLNKKSESSKQ